MLVQRSFLQAAASLSVVVTCLPLYSPPTLPSDGSSDPAVFVFVFMLNERAGASAHNPTNLHSLSLSLVVYIYVCIQESAALAN